MTDTFEGLSKKIANDFLQSIIFIDDKAYADPSAEDCTHDFNAREVTQKFASENKICAVYQPESEQDVDDLCLVSQKADVAVIDWHIIFPAFPALNIDDGEVDDVDDLRGMYTKKIIASLLSPIRAQHSLKLIIIYTGETGLAGIAEEVKKHLADKSISGFEISSNDPCCVFSKNCRILVVAKDNGGKKGTSYQDLPELITKEFSVLTAGLLSNFALKSLTVIRENFYQILNLFSKELDSAYLANQSLLITTEDANEQLVELLGDTFISVMRAEGLHKSVDEVSTRLWVKQFLVEKNSSIENTELEAELDKIMKVLKSNNAPDQKYKEALGCSKNKYKKEAMKLFSNSEDDAEIENKNKDFARLCQHKNLLHCSDPVPVLTLGTVVKSTQDSDKYLVCIQQRCDSVRIKEGSPRRFLFLSLTVVDVGVFDFTTPNPDGVKLKLDKNSYDIRTVKFEGSTGVVKGKESTCGSVYFQPVHFSESHSSSEKFEFIFELKDLYAQKIVEKYSSLLSRVGVNEPEWLRS